MRVRILIGALAAVVCCLAPAPASASLNTGSAQVVASGLEVPWDVLRLPDGRTLVTELPRRVRVIDQAGTLRAAPAYVGAGLPAGIQKFLGMAIDPAYATNRFVYLYVSYGSAANPNANRVIRLTDDGSDLGSPVTIFGTGIHSDGSHDGGQIAFGPDGMLYVTTGDIHNPNLPQDKTSANGKILRMTRDGGAPADNPFNQGGSSRYVWSYGHRHPQGIGWDACGRMWESEHGPSGEGYAGQTPPASGNDEINRIDPGANYGWPTIVGDQTAPGMRNPVAHAPSSSAWAPGGLAFGPDRVMYTPFLAGQELRAFTTSGDSITGQASLFKGTYNRLRAATADSTHLWLTTSNNSTDEKVLKVAFDPASIPAQPPAGCPPTAATPAPAAPTARLTRVQLRKIIRGILDRQARALRSKRARKLAKVKRLRLSDRVLPAGRMSISLERPGVRRKRARLTVLAGKATTRAGRRATVTTKLSSKSRRMLRTAARRKGRLKLTLRVALRTADGRLTTGRRTVTILRR